MLTTITGFLGNLTWSTIVLIGIVIYFVVKNGIPSVIAWFQRMWAYFVSGEATLKADLAAVIADVAAIKAHFVSTGVTLPPPPAPPATH